MSTPEAHQRGLTYWILAGIVFGVMVANFFDALDIGAALSATIGAGVGGGIAVFGCNQAYVLQKKHMEVPASWKNIAIAGGIAGIVYVITILTRRLG